MIEAMPPYDLTRKPERRWLGACLACHCLLASALATALHEGGHIIGHLVAGDTIYGYFVTPFAGQVLALYPSPSAILDALVDLGGIATTQCVFYGLAGVRLSVGRRIPFFLDSLLVMLLVVLAFDASYLMLSGPLHFGDAYNAAKSLGWPAYAFSVPGFLLAYANYRLVRRLLGQWAERSFGETAVGSTRTILCWFFAVLIPVTMAYWLITGLMESPW